MGEGVGHGPTTRSIRCGAILRRTLNKTTAEVHSRRQLWVFYQGDQIISHAGFAAPSDAVPLAADTASITLPTPLAIMNSQKGSISA